ncbi:MAG TPA: hypothetical protein VJS64_14905 [Pyrinomonadaceae bacterium]|nr:hypothetical protein [Pyrinomonadaceae bacterium]
MKYIIPQPPFVWPEPRVIEGIATYEHESAFEDLVTTSQSVFGTVSAITDEGVGILKRWLDSWPDFKARLIVTLYPTCATREDDLLSLLKLVGKSSERLLVHIYPLKRLSDRALNALAFLSKSSDHLHFVVGASSNFGLNLQMLTEANFAFRGDPAMVESFKRYFDWLWAKSEDLRAEGVTRIPNLIVPEGTQEGATLWQNYINSCSQIKKRTADVNENGNATEVEEPKLIAHVNEETGDVTITSSDGQELKPPTEELGVAKLDQLAEQMSRIYEKGSLVSIDKLSRIPPLDTPVKPSIFGDEAEMVRDSVTRRVATRVSAIDATTLKEIEKRRKSLSPLLSKFSFGLADNLRWMPLTARDLFESEVTRANNEGLKLISNLLKGDIDAYLRGRRESLIANINRVYSELGRSGEVSPDVIDAVVNSLKTRLEKAQSSNFMPKLSYSAIVFERKENAYVSPWGQAYSLLSQVAAFPRKVIADPYFLRGIKVAEEELIEAMNVADDYLSKDLRVRGIKGRCEAELELLLQIKNVHEARQRCELVAQIISGASHDEVRSKLSELETSISESTETTDNAK